MKKELTLQDIETGETWYSTYGEEIVEYEYLCEYPSGNFHIIHDKKQDMPLKVSEKFLENMLKGATRTYKEAIEIVVGYLEGELNYFKGVLFKS